MWYSLLLLGYKPVQHVTVLNTVGNCNTMVSIIILYYYNIGDRGSTVVKVLWYKSKGRWFDSTWCHWNFSLT